MVFPDASDCARCRGTGTVRLKLNGGTVVITCGCRVGRLLAATVDYRTARSHG